MRPWIIVLSSAIGAIVAAALAWPELSDATRSDLAPNLLRHLPVLVVAALAVYALGAMLLTTATLISGTLRARHRLARPGAYGASAQSGWMADFGWLQRLAPRLAQPAKPGASIVLQSRFDPNEARGEIARLLYIWMARTHFFSALIVLAAVVGLGLAQDHGSIPFVPNGIPTVSAALILAGLLLLAILGRIAIDVTVEPLFETISQLPAENIEVRLLRRAVEVLEAASGAPGSTPHLPDRLIGAIEEGHRALRDTIGRLSATVDALGATMQSSVEAVETAMRTTVARLPLIAENSYADAARFSELQAAVEVLTAVLQGLTALPDNGGALLPGPDIVPRRRVVEPQLTRELRKLLQEIEAAS